MDGVRNAVTGAARDFSSSISSARDIVRIDTERYPPPNPNPCAPQDYMNINEQTKQERKNHPPDTFDTFIWEALVHHFNDNEAKKRRLEISQVQ